MPSGENVILYEEKKPRSNHSEKDRGKLYFYVKVKLVGKDLPFIHGVTYYFHDQVSEVPVEIDRSIQNPSCETIIKTFGHSTIRAEILDLNNNTQVIEHYMMWGDELINSGISPEDISSPKYFKIKRTLERRINNGKSAYA